MFRRPGLSADKPSRLRPAGHSKGRETGTEFVTESSGPGLGVLPPQTQVGRPQNTIKGPAQTQ